MPKTYANTYLFNQYHEYEKKMYEFIMTAERIDTKSDQFADLLYDFKRRNVGNSLLKIITSNNVILAVKPGIPLPKAFKVFVAKDVKEDKTKMKVFIDVSEIIALKNGAYTCNKLEWLTSYVISAMTAYVYAMNETKLTGNSSILKDGGEAFAKCYSYIIDRMYKITTVPQLRNKVEYISAIYYQVNILGKNLEKNYDSIKANALRISDLDPKLSQVIDMMISDKDFININAFNQAVARVFSFMDFKTSNVISMWMQAFGTGTVFAMEFLPAFATMLTNTYIGGYIDQQMTIEKITGTSMVSFSKTILQIGASV